MVYSPVPSEMMPAGPLHVICEENNYCNNKRDQNKLIYLEIKIKIMSLMSRKLRRVFCFLQKELISVKSLKSTTNKLLSPV